MDMNIESNNSSRKIIIIKPEISSLVDLDTLAVVVWPPAAILVKGSHGDREL